MSGLAIVAVFVGGVVVASALCWLVVEAATRRSRGPDRDRRD